MGRPWPLTQALSLLCWVEVAQPAVLPCPPWAAPVQPGLLPSLLLGCLHGKLGVLHTETALRRTICLQLALAQGSGQ